MPEENGKANTKINMPQIGEAVFCVLYLIFDAVAAVIFFAGARGRSAITLFGVMTLVLGAGDAFHLVPRIVKAFRPSLSEDPQLQKMTGLGLLVSSVTMTVYYILLAFIWAELFPDIKTDSAVITAIFAILFISAAVRIILCFFPQNNWFRPEGNPKWGMIRNVPFAVTGLCDVILFFLSGNDGGHDLWLMSVAIIISFACYFPVVLFAKKKPAVGMLMIPKTIAYIWMISMGLRLVSVL